MISPTGQSSSVDRVFDRPLHLAGVLDNAADDLNRTWFGYEWNDRTRCNCGIVARQVLQTTAPKLKELLPPIYHDGAFYPTWSSMTGQFCSASGLSENEVFRRLFSAGLRYGDFFHLEELSHPEILKHLRTTRRPTFPVLRSRKSDVIAYLRTWAEGIEDYRDELTAGRQFVDASNG